MSLAQLTNVAVKDGAYDIYREGNTRYVAVTFNMRGRDLGTTVEDAIKRINDKVKLPPGYRVEWSENTRVKSGLKRGWRWSSR